MIRLRTFRVVAYESRLRRPFVTARRSTQGATNYLVMVEADHGRRALTGVGEATPRGRLTGDPPRHVWPFLTAAADALRDAEMDTSSPEACLASVRHHLDTLATLARSTARAPKGTLPLRGSIAGVEIALLDLAARAFDMPLGRFLGGQADAAIEVTASSSSVSRDLDEVRRRLLKRTRRFGGWRLKADGRMDANLAVLQEMTAINRELGRDNLMWLDFNEAANNSEAVAFLDAIALENREARIAGKIILEQPIQAERVVELCALQRHADNMRAADLEVVIMADECLHTLADLEALQRAGGCRGINIKVPKAGGLLASIDLARAATRFDPAVEIYLGGMIATSEVTAWALNQLAKALPGFRYTTVVPHRNLAVNFSTRRYAFRDSDTAVIADPGEPGLGTSVDAERLAPLVIKEHVGGSVTAEQRAAASAPESAAEREKSPWWLRLRPLAGLVRPTSTTRKGMRSLLVDSLKTRGITYTLLTPEESAALGMMPKKGLRFSLGDVTLHFVNGLWYRGSPPKLLNGLPGRLFPDKALTSAILRAAGLPTPAAYKIASGERANLQHLFRGLTHVAPRGLVVKPNRGLLGQRVFLGIQSLEAFERAVREVGADGGAVLVETMVPGAIHRLFVVDGHTVATRTGHSDTGHSNRHQGARIIDTTHTLHPSYKALAEHAIAQFPGTFIAGLDLAVTDATAPANPGPDPNCHIIEINSYPGFIGHHNPDEGQPIDVAGAIIDALIRRFARSGAAVPPPTHLIVQGSVQRVGYRHWLQNEARQRGVTGFVRNRSDGTVEAVLCGTPDAVAALVDLARSGPPRARVTGVETRAWGGRQRYRSFLRLKTATDE